MTNRDSASELQRLLQLAREQDDNALGQLLEQHRHWLRTEAEKELQGQLAARIDASDIVQQTFLSACSRIRQFEGNTSGELAAWLRQIQERNLRDAVRRHVTSGRRSVTREEPFDEQQTVRDREVSTPSQHAMRSEREIQLARMLEQLPDDQREAVRLRHLEGWSLSQMASHFGRSHEAVAALLKRGVENLRNQVPAD